MRSVTTIEHEADVLFAQWILSTMGRTSSALRASDMDELIDAALVAAFLSARSRRQGL